MAISPFTVDGAQKFELSRKRNGMSPNLIRLVSYPPEIKNVFEELPYRTSVKLFPSPLSPQSSVLRSVDLWVKNSVIPTSGRVQPCPKSSSSSLPSNHKYLQ